MLAMKLTFPDTDNFPTFLAQGTRDDPVPRYIVLELTSPEFESAFRRVRKFATAMPMPKASVHKDRKPLASKNEVRPAEHARVSSPARDAVALE